MSKKQKRIVFAVEFIVRLTTLCAVLFGALSIIGMIEAMKVSAETLRVFIPCVAWLAVVGLYVRLVNK